MAYLAKEQYSRFESQEDITAVLELSDSQVAKIDGWLLSHASSQYQKVAMVVSKSLMQSDAVDELTHIPDVFFCMRVEALVQKCLLQGQGDLTKMRSSEVRVVNNATE